MTPHVSVCIPVRNMGAVLADQLGGLAAQRSAPAFEVVVVDDGSDDDPAAAVAAFADRLHVSLRRRTGAGKGINGARNLAVRAAAADKILFCDADDIVGERWVASLSEALDHVDLVSGVAHETCEGTTVRVWGGEVRLNFLPSPIGASCGFRRSAFDAIGGFDETWSSGGDDYEFFFRAQLAGATLDHVPDAVIDYRQPVRTAGEAFRRAATRARADVRLFHRFRDDGMPRSSGMVALRSIGAVAKRLPVLHDPAERRLVARVIGRRWGRLTGSWAFRCWYP